MAPEAQEGHGKVSSPGISHRGGVQSRAKNGRITVSWIRQSAWLDRQSLGSID